METTRVEERKLKKKAFWNEVLFAPKLVITLLLSFVLYAFSMAFILTPLNGTPYSTMADGMITINVMAIGIFMLVGFTNIKLLVVFIKSLLKIMFTVWLVTIIQFSKLNQVEQNVWTVLSAFFFVYLEVLLELNDFLFQVPDFQSKKIHFLNNNFLKKYSIPISITFLSFINFILSFFIVDLLKIINA